jgi:2-C-methyl-D-erythritol 4-phosphate cytidylyltransferase
MIEWSLDALRGCESVRSIVVACPPGHDHALGGGDLEVVDGGATRSRSVSNALAAVETELVAIHDAARPLITPALVDAIVATLTADPDAAGAIAATPVVDTIKRTTPRRCSLSVDSTAKEQREGEGGPDRLRIGGTLDRSTLWAAQTPQVFRAAALRRALAAADDPDAATDEAMLVEQAGGRVLLHPVAEPNLKVTTPFDLRLAELLLAERAA